MEWLIILALAVIGLPPIAFVWVWRLSARVRMLEQRIAALEARAVRPTAAAAPVATLAPVAEPEAPSVTVATPAALDEPLLLDQPLPPDDREPLLLTNVVPPDELLLDTPLPAASNDQDAETATPASQPPEPPVAIPAAAHPPPRSVRRDGVRFETWLAENGLAWFGGGAIALGVILLVAFAAGQSWFTAPVRLVCALLAGAALLAASEWVRRRGDNTLVAALLAGAGAVAFYAVAWASHGLYHFIDWPTATALLTLCALLLFGLSLIHGQALGVLAIIAALLAPAFANAPIWPSLALTLYVGAVGVAGFAIAWLRRWAWVTAAAIVGLYFWFAAAITADDVWRAVALISFATLGGAATARRAPLDGAPNPSWTRAHEAMPTIAICVSSTLLMWTWFWAARAPELSVAGPAIAALGHVALAGLAIRARAIHPMALAIAIAGLCLGFVFFLIARPMHVVLDHGFFAWILFAPIVVALTALAARPHHTGRKRIAATGAVGTALLYVLAAFSRDAWASPSTWGPLFVGAVLLWVSALVASRDAPKPENDLGVDMWSGAAAVLLLIGIESAFPAVWRPAADAGAALLAGAAVWRRNWRAMRWAAPFAAAIGIAHALSRDLFGAAAANAMPLWLALAILGLAAVLLLAAARFAQRDRATSEALSTASLLMLVTGVFLLLRWMGAGHSTGPLDHFSEDALRALALMAAGHVVLPPANTPPLGRIATWRAHLLIGAGALYAIYAPVLLTNPWWGEFPARIVGPPVFNALLLALAAPAAFLFYAAARLYRDKRTLARIYASVGGFVLLTWLVVEIRHIFHAGAMASAPLGVFEAACYGLVFIALALALAAIGKLRAQHDPDRPFAHDLVLVTRGVAWTALTGAVLLMLLARHPWWGEQDAKNTSALSSGLAIAAQAMAATLSLALGRALSRSVGRDPARFAAAAIAALFTWSFGHAALRWLFHGGAMDYGASNVGLEGFAHALWPLAFVLGASAFTVRAPRRDDIRPYLYDLQAIWSVAVWPVMVFAALGLWLLYAPWWGWAPVQVSSAAAAVFGIAAPLAAAWMSLAAARVPHLRWATVFAQVMRVTCAGHLLLAITLIVRWSFHYAAMNTTAPADGLELWTYSAVFALFGGGMIALGAVRRDASLNRIGLVILFAAAAKVVIVDTAQLNGVLRAASFLGVGVVSMLVAWATRRIGQAPKLLGPDDLAKITPGSRRDRRDGRR